MKTTHSSNQTAEIFIKGAYEVRCVDVSKLVFGNHVRSACEMNSCGMYGKCWTCPPNAGSLQALYSKIMKYEKVLIFTYAGQLEDSFDLEGMNEARDKAKQLLKDVSLQFEKEGVSFMPLGCGACSICEKCTCPDKPCRFPDSAVLSVEACGIDVVETAKNISVNYYNGVNTVTYFNMILF